MIPGDVLSACPHRQFHTIPDLLDSRARLSNSYPYALVTMQGGSLYHFYDGERHVKPGPTCTKHLNLKCSLFLTFPQDL